jgi:hypothetical protein
MEPRIQYAQTADGVNIAFWTLGEGIAFVHLAPLPLSHGRSPSSGAGSSVWRRTRS